jgi:hypothetical protein
MSQPQADRFAAGGKSGYPTRSRTGSTINLKALITSTAARIVGSETCSTVMTNDLPGRLALNHESVLYVRRPTVPPFAGY